MDFLSPQMLNWKRISVIMFFMVSISIITSKLPSLIEEQTLRKNVREIDSKCPVYYQNGLTLDSIRLIPPRVLTFYVTDYENILTMKEKERMEKSFKAAFEKNIKDDALEYFQKNRFELVYDFLDTDGNLIFSFNLKNEGDH
jgi:hypothetical protein